MHNIIMLIVLLTSLAFSALDTVKVPVIKVSGQNYALIYPDSVTCIPFTLSPYWTGSMINGVWVKQEVIAWYQCRLDTKGVNGTLHIQIKTTSNSILNKYDTTQIVHFYIYKYGVSVAVLHSSLYVIKPILSSRQKSFYFDFVVDSPIPKIAFSEQTPDFVDGSAYKTTGTVIITFSSTGNTSAHNKITAPALPKESNYKFYDVLGRNAKSNSKTPYISKKQILIKVN